LDYQQCRGTVKKYPQIAWDSLYSLNLY
jgi:hypothetical protein